MIVVVVCCDADNDIFGGKIKAMGHFLTASFYYRRMVVGDHYLLVGSILGLECIYILYRRARIHKTQPYAVVAAEDGE